MRIPARPLAVLSIAIFLPLIVACGTTAPPSATSTSNTPTAVPVEPTPIPQQARDAATEFEEQQKSIAEDWATLHSDFDKWRTGLISCDRSSIQASLQGFSGDFSPIAQEAQRLPRSTVGRSLSDKLIEATTNEEAALRQLRDQWQSGDTSLFAALEVSRTNALSLQKEAEDELLDLREANGDDEEEDEDAAAFSEALDTLVENWEKFHEDYATLRDDRDNLDTGEVSAQLSALVDQLSDVIAAIDELPAGDATDSIIASLKEAAEAEAAPLTELTDAYQALPDESEEPEANGEVAPALFDAVDATIDDGEKALKDSLKDSESNGEAASPEDLEALNEYESAADSLIQKWDSFHEDYDAWQQTGRGCDAAAAAQSLGEFANRAGILASRVRALPQTGLLATIGDTLVEAAEREEEAFRDLRNNWRPFGSEVYRGVDRERVNAQQLRRQSGQGMQQLTARLKTSP